MGETLSHLMDSVTAPIRDVATRMARNAAELALMGVFALIGLGFLVAALAVWLVHLWGPIIAMLAMAGLFFVVAVILYAVWASGQAADRRKAEEAAREKAARGRSSSSLLGGSWLNTAMNLWPLLSLAAKRRRQVKEERELKTLRRQAAMAGRSTTDTLAEEARTAAHQVSESARTVTRKSSETVRGSMQAVGPWAIVAVAVAGGIITSLAMRRRRR